MKLEELHQHWQDYAIEFWKKPKCSVILKCFYHRCELGKMKKPYLEFFPRYDDGTWSSGIPHAFRCDKNGNCYQYMFYTTNINKFRWVKVGRFVKIGSK